MKNPWEPLVAPFRVWLEAGSAWRPAVAGACSWFVGVGMVIFVVGIDRSTVLLAAWFGSSALWGALAGLVLIIKRGRQAPPDSNSDTTRRGV